MDATFQSSSFEDEGTSPAKKPASLARKSSSMYGSVFGDDESPRASELPPAPAFVGADVSESSEGLISLDKALESLQGVPAKRSLSGEDEMIEAVDVGFQPKKQPPGAGEAEDLHFNDVFDADQASAPSFSENRSPAVSFVEEPPSHGTEIREQSSRIRVRRHTSFEEEERFDLDAVLEAASMETAKRSDAFVDALHAGVTPEDVSRLVEMERLAPVAEEAPSMTPAKEEPLAPIAPLPSTIPPSAEKLISNRPVSDNASDFDLEAVLEGEAAAKEKAEAAAAAASATAHQDTAFTPVQGGMMEHPIESDIFPSAVSPHQTHGTTLPMRTPSDVNLSSHAHPMLHHREASEFDLASAFQAKVSDIPIDLAVASPRPLVIPPPEEDEDEHDMNTGLNVHRIDSSSSVLSVPPLMQTKESSDFIFNGLPQPPINESAFVSIPVPEGQMHGSSMLARTPSVTRQSSSEGTAMHRHPHELNREDIEAIAIVAAEPPQVLMVDESVMSSGKAPDLLMESVRTPPATRQNSIVEDQGPEDDDQEGAEGIHRPLAPKEVELAAERASRMVGAPLFAEFPAATSVVDPSQLTQTELLNRQLLMSAAASSIPSQFFDANRGNEREDDESPMEDEEDGEMPEALKAYIDRVKAEAATEGSDDDEGTMVSVTPPEFPSAVSDFSFQPDVHGPLKLQRQFTSETDFEIGSAASPTPHRVTPADTPSRATEDDDTSTTSSTPAMPTMVMTTDESGGFKFTPMTSAAMASAVAEGERENVQHRESSGSERSTNQPFGGSEPQAASEAMVPPAVPTDVNQEEQDQAGVDDEDTEFAGFQEASPAPAPAASAAVQQEEEDDDFGDFEDAAPASAAPVAVMSAPGPVVLAPPPAPPAPVAQSAPVEAAPSFFAAEPEKNFEETLGRPPCPKCGAPTNFELFSLCVACGDGQKSPTTPGATASTRLANVAKASSYHQPHGNESILNDLLTAIEFESCLEDPSSLPIAALAANDNDGALRVLLGNDVIDSRTPTKPGRPQETTLKKKLDPEEDKSFFVV